MYIYAFSTKTLSEVVIIFWNPFWHLYLFSQLALSSNHKLFTRLFYRLCASGNGMKPGSDFFFLNPEEHFSTVPLILQYWQKSTKHFIRGISLLIRIYHI